MFNIKKKFWQGFIFLLGGIFLFSPFSFSSDSFLKSNLVLADITQDTTWTAASSPYIIRHTVYVKPSATLTIEPGVVVKLEASSLIIEGHLKALGAESDKIIFTSYYDDEHGGDSDGTSWQPQAGDWTSIHFVSGAVGQLDNVLVRYGGLMPICIGKKSDNFLQAKTAYAFGSCFYKSKGAIRIFSAQLTIENSEIKQNNYGIELEDQTSNLIIRNSKIYQNIDYGIYNKYSNPGVADAIENWWGDDSGPAHPSNPSGKGDRITDNVLFDPWLGKTKKLEPVIIIPGIIGSYLNRNESGKPEVWPNIDQMIMPGSDSYLEELAMTDAGWPNENLIPTDIIRKIFISDFFQGLLTELENNGYQEGKNLFVFPYDWRFFIDWSAAEGDPFPLVKSLKEKVEEVKEQTGADKVNIVAHSMGGLVAKYYIKYYGRDSVDKFIDIATPHLGAPKAFKILMYGDDLDFNLIGILKLNPDTLKSISQNIPSIYQLLPSRNYFTNVDPDYNFYLADIHDLDNNGIKGGLNYDQSLEFMKNTGRNDYLLEFNDSLHNALDNYSPRLDDLKTYNLIGCGQPTLGKVYVLNKEKSGKYEYGLKYINGDGTVPLRSAETFLADKTYYLTGAEHVYLPSADGVKQLIAVILKDEEENFNFSIYSNLRQDKNNCSFSGKQISFHSPIDIHIYDENNNHTGPDQSGDIELGIPGVQYDIIEDNKFVFLPPGHNYHVVGQATAVGSFNARIQEIDNNQYGEMVYYNEIPLKTNQTQVQLPISDNQTDYQISLDQDGDQIFESQIQPNSILDETEAQDSIKPETSINISGATGNNDWYVSDVQIELSAQDNENGSGVLKTEFSLDQGQSWRIYQEPIALVQEGEATFLYQSTDRAGNSEQTKEQKIKIDKEGPNIKILVPGENQEILRSETLNPDYQTTDNYSVVDSATIALFLDNQLISANPIDLFNYSLGKHKFKIIAQDQAGNGSEAEVQFIIGANIESAIADIERSYQEGLIKKKFVRDWLISTLEQIKDQHTRLKEKQGKGVKGWFVKIHRAIILKQYQLILKRLNLFHRQKWLDDQSYSIIGEDVKYLIKNLQGDVRERRWLKK